MCYDDNDNVGDADDVNDNDNNDGGQQHTLNLYIYLKERAADIGAFPKLFLCFSGPKINFVFLNCKHIINSHDSISGGGRGGVAQSTPTNQKPSNAPIFVHSCIVVLVYCCVGVSLDVHT